MRAVGQRHEGQKGPVILHGRIAAILHTDPCLDFGASASGTAKSAESSGRGNEPRELMVGGNAPRVVEVHHTQDGREHGLGHGVQLDQATRKMGNGRQGRGGGGA
jgi:hypothetical protein